MKIKRIILSTLLGASIIGISSFAVLSKIELEDITDSKLIDLVGSKDTLGDNKITSTLRINGHELETMISKDTNNYRAYIDGYKSSIDKKLTKDRGFSTFSENEKFSVALTKDSNEIDVRYKDKNQNSYKDFSINDKDLDGNLINSYVKDNVVYTLCSQRSDTQSILKIDLNSEKLIDKFVLPKKVNIQRRYNKKEIIKNNKMYMPALGEKPSDGISIFTFDLEKETFETKEVKPKNIGYIFSTNTSFLYDDKYICYGMFNADKRELGMLLYNLETESVNEIIMKDDVFKNFDTVFLEDYKVDRDKLYLCGRVENRSFINSFVTVIDLSKSSLEYAGILKYNLRFSSMTTKFQ